MNVNRFLVLVAALLVAGTLALAFTITGSPQHQRELAIDRQRTQDLTRLAWRINDKYGDPGERLPRTLPGSLIARDPVTHEPYEYRRTGTTKYLLCATFTLASEDRNGRDASGNPWEHPSGRTCYHLDAKSG